MDVAAQLQLLGERLDALVTLDVPSRNVIHLLYPMARRKQGAPLCLAAAELLAARVRPGDVVMLATGWPDRPHITPAIAETDGPPGAAALARALHRGLGAVPVVLIEDHLVPAMARVVQAAGFRVLTPEEAIASHASHAPIHGAAVIGFPTDGDAAKERALELLSAYQPKAVITIEKGGMNDRGVIHTSRGAETTGPMAKIDHLMVAAAADGVATIGIGDGGNEIGMGVIRGDIEREIPYGASCLCGCGGGIAPATEVDVLIAAAISNWGAYGVAAALAALCHDTDVFHDRAVEHRMLTEAANASFIDGITGFVDPSADGVAAEEQAAFVTIMRETLRQVLARL
jgi:D-glutamate cyclase